MAKKCTFLNFKQFQLCKPRCSTGHILSVKIAYMLHVSIHYTSPPFIVHTVHTQCWFCHNMLLFDAKNIKDHIEALQRMNFSAVISVGLFEYILLLTSNSVYRPHNTGPIRLPPTLVPSTSTNTLYGHAKPRRDVTEWGHMCTRSISS